MSLLKVKPSLSQAHEAGTLSVKDQSRETNESKHRRKALGIYYTPPEAALVLARWAVRSPDDTVLEPSFGGCAMLTAAISVFRTLGNASPSSQLFGFDVDVTAFRHLEEMGVENRNQQFKRADFLRTEADSLYVDAVLANPPFVPYHRQNQSQRRITEKLRAKYFPDLPRFASLWAYFVLHSLTYLRTGGRMAFVLPNAIGTADYGRSLLKYLSNRFRKVEVIYVKEPLFIQVGADERVALLLLSDYSQAEQPPVPVFITELAKIRDIPNGNLLDTESALQSVNSASGVLSPALKANLIEMQSIASIQIGEVIGDVRFFVRPKKIWKELNVPEQYLFPILTRSSQATSLLLDREYIESDESNIPYLLLPPEGGIPKEIRRILATYSLDLVKKNVTFQKRPLWYRCSYVTNADAFIGSMNHDWPRIVGNDSRITCSNSYYKVIVDKEAMAYKKWLPIISLTTPFRISAEIIGRVRGSGGLKLEPSDVRKLLIPAKLAKTDSRQLKKLRERINLLVTQGDIQSATKLADSAMFVVPGIATETEMSQLEKHRIALTSRRLL